MKQQRENFAEGPSSSFLESVEKGEELEDGNATVDQRGTALSNGQVGGNT